MEIGGQLEAAKRCLAAARSAEVREVRQALARCAERYILGALGYERMGSGAAQERAAPSPHQTGEWGDHYTATHSGKFRTANSPWSSMASLS